MSKKAGVAAKHGEKMIELKLCFWTNNIAPRGKVLPKHGRSRGVVRIQSNKAHGIVAGGPTPFNSLMEIGAVIEKVLIKHGIIL
jgi:hypothetical protein